MNKNKIFNADCLEIMKTLDDNSIDLIFTDPPYALGSEVIIKENGKPDYKKAVDFMGAWKMPTGEFWEEWFFEAKRILKFGGHCLMFGIDRQTFLFKYFANFNGFKEKQSLYWYFISNFPKSSDLSKNLDKHFGEDREIIGTKGKFSSSKSSVYAQDQWTLSQVGKDVFETSATSELAKKFDGYKYSIAPLKQTCEEIMVFQKPYKTGSCLHDILAMESGDESITCGALNIEGNKVSCNLKNERRKDLEFSGQEYRKYKSKKGWIANKEKLKGIGDHLKTGRYPAQTFINEQTAGILDEQSGDLIGSGDKDYDKSLVENHKTISMNKMPQRHGVWEGVKDIGGSSKVLHKCNYESDDFDILNYCAKVSQTERNIGGDENNHPTLKPIKLLERILSLFKSPDKQIILDCFAGSGSTGLACEKLDLDYILIEKDEKYFEILKNRVGEYRKTLTRNLFEEN